MLKLFALIVMTADHIGAYLLPQYRILRIIGRLAFPIFAYMIAEGCTYTKNRKRYLLGMVILSVLCQSVYYIAQRSLYMSIPVTFSLSITLIYAWDKAFKEKSAASFSLLLIAFFSVYFISVMLPKYMSSVGFDIDYGFFGIMVPVFIYIGNTHLRKIALAALALAMLAAQYGGVQWYSLLALVPLALYNGNRGKPNIKYLFYIYYPAHLAVIYLIGLTIK